MSLSEGSELQAVNKKVERMIVMIAYVFILNPFINVDAWKLLYVQIFYEYTIL